MRKKEILKILCVAVLLVLMIRLTWIFHGFFKTGKVFTHLYYIPIALASVWWEKKGILVALFLSGVLLLSAVLIKEYDFALADFIRSGIFLSVSGIIALLSEALVREKTAKYRFAKKSITDALTGLKNYSFFEKVSNVLLETANKYEIPFSLVMMDIDRFKKVNDTYGHKTGDLVLKEFASAMKKIFRKTDVLIRYGGDEFLVLLPGMEKKNAAFVMEKLKCYISDHPLDCGGKRIEYGFSWGASQAGETINTINGMFKEADEELYLAKEKY